MAFEWYLNKSKDKNFKKLVLSQDQKALLHLKDGNFETLSELPLNKEEIESILKDLAISITANEVHQKGNFVKEANQYSYHILNLEDHIRVEFLPLKENKIKSLEDLEAPNYLKDWAQVKKGLVIFYGPQRDAVEAVRFSFCRERLAHTKGTSLVFKPQASGTLDFSVLQESHSLSISSKEKEFASIAAEHNSFDLVSFFSDLNEFDPAKLLKKVERGSLITLNSGWSSMEHVLYDLKKWVEPRLPLELFASSVLGLVGVRMVSSQFGDSVPIFELSSFENIKDKSFGPQLKETLLKEGLSFNQSLYSKVLKRQVSLETAYLQSSEPEELNKMLEGAGI